MWIVGTTGGGLAFTECSAIEMLQIRMKLGYQDVEPYLLSCCHLNLAKRPPASALNK